MTIALILAMTATPDGGPAGLLPDRPDRAAAAERAGGATGDPATARRAATSERGVTTAVGAVVASALAAGCGQVVILTRAGWAGAISEAVGQVAPDGTSVRVPDGAGHEHAGQVDAVVTAGGGGSGGGGEVEVLTATGGNAERATALAVLRRAEGSGQGLAVVHAHLIADEVTLTPLLDGQGGTVVLAAAGPRPDVVVDGGNRADAAAVRPGTGVYVQGLPELRTLRGRVVAASSPEHELIAPTEHGLGALSISTGAVPGAVSLLSRSTADAGKGAQDGAGKGAQEGAEAVAPPRPRRLHQPGELVEPADGDDRIDLLASLLVGLVRTGIPVTSRPPARAGVARLVTSSEVARTALEQCAGLDVDRVRLQESVKRDDGFFTTFLVSSWSTWVVRAARARGLSPDAVTWWSMALGVLAAVSFAVGSTLWSALGAVLLYLAFVLDCVDGQLARATRRFSARGAWLDAMFDRGKEYVVYAGLAVGAVRAGDDVGVWLLAGAALALQTVRHTLDLGYAAQQAADVERLVRRDLADPHDPGPSFWEVGHAAPTTERGPTAVSEAASGAVQGGGVATEASATGPSGQPRSALPRRVIIALRQAEAVAVLKWAKRIVILPIGERFALIGVLAVVTTPRVLFVVLLTWGGLATLYTAGGRVVRSVA